MNEFKIKNLIFYAQEKLELSVMRDISQIVC